MAEVYLPSSLEEVFGIVSKIPSARLFAGGTDLMVRLSREGMEGTLVCLEGVDELRAIDESSDEVRIGAAITHSELISSDLIDGAFPLLREAARHVGAPAVRNMGTLGGNICTASPAGDTLPALYIYGAEVELRSPRGERRIPIEVFISGPGRTQLKPDEVLYAVVLGKDHGFNFHHFEKVGQRKAMALCAVVLCRRHRFYGTGTRGTVRFEALLDVSPRRSLVDFLGKCLTGRCPEAAAMTAMVFVPYDVRASEKYRRRVAGNCLRREGMVAATNDTAKASHVHS